MMKTMTAKILSWPPYGWLIPYVFLQAFLYFHPFIHGTAGSFYYLAVDPELFARDIIRTSAFGTTTYFYKFMHLLLGDNTTNIYYLFWPYLIVCGLIAWGIFSVGKLVSGGRAEGGILLLLFFIVEKQIIEGAYISITRTDFHYQHFTLPLIIFAVYFLLKERYLYFSLFMVVSFYFHFKTPIAIGLAALPMLVYRLKENPKQLKYVLAPAVLLIPKFLSILNILAHQQFASISEKREYFNLVLHREEMEGAMYFNAAGTAMLVVYGLIAWAGFWSLRYVKDKRLQKNIFLCHIGVWLAFGVGTILRIADHFWGPLGEVVFLAYSRASILGVLLTAATVSLYFLNAFETNLKQKNVLRLFVLSFLIFFIGVTTFILRNPADGLVQKKMLLQVLIFAVFAAIAANVGRTLDIKKFSMLLLIFALLYVGMKVPMMLKRSYVMEYPYFPFVPDPAFYNRELAAAQDWVKDNTAKDDLVLVATGAGTDENDYCSGIYRNRMLRSVWCQDLTSTYGDVSAFREWKRRKALLREYLARPFSEWNSLFAQEKINYVLSSRKIIWPNLKKAAFENDSYAVYATAQ